jgi:recombination protein RecA
MAKQEVRKVAANKASSTGKAKSKDAAAKEAEGKKKALEKAIGMIHQQFGDNSIMRLGDGSMKFEGGVISTGALTLDLALGIGGIPRGRVVELYGPESSGKTTLAMHVMANAQKNGGNAVLIDAEHAFDPGYARKLGLKVDELHVSQPDYGEQALNIVERLIKSNAIDVIVVDSVAALIPKAELDGATGDQFMGLQARMMSQAMRKLTGIVSKTSTTVIFINQLREKIGVMFGSPETTPGGRALKFYSSVRLDIRRIGGIKQAERDIGNVVRVKVVKNKMAPPARKAEFDLMFGTGISWEGSVLDGAMALGLITKSGAFFSFGETKLGQGRERAKQFLVDNKDVCRKLEKSVRAADAAGDLNVPTRARGRK